MQLLNNYSFVKDYYGITPPTSSDLPLDKRSIRDPEFRLERLEQIFDQSLLKELNIDFSKTVPFNQGEPNGVYRANIFSGDCQISFDDKGDINEIIRDLPDVENTATEPASLILAKKIAFERFGKALDFKNKIFEFSYNIIQSNLPPNKEVELVKWHFDSNRHYSLVILLSDPLNEKKGWKGGDLLYRGRAKQEPYGMPCRDPRSPTWKVSYGSAGNGILFSNKGTQHNVTPITAYSRDDDQPVERLIMTIFCGKIEA